MGSKFFDGKLALAHQMEHGLHVALGRPAHVARRVIDPFPHRRVPRPGPRELETVNSSSFLKNGGRGKFRPTTPTRTTRPFGRHTSAANSMGSLLSVAAVITRHPRLSIR